MKKIFSILLTITVLCFATGVVLIQPAQAASLTALSDTMSSVKTGVVSSHVIRFTTPTGTSDAGETIIITFPSDFNFTDKAINTVTFTHGASTGAESAETLAAAASATEWGAVFSGTQNRVFTLTAPTDGVGTAALAASDKVIITYSSANSTNGSAASYGITIAGTFGDTGTITITIVSDDQVAVSATVGQTLSFSLGANTLNLGALSSSAATSGSHTMTVATNAVSGMSVSVSGVTLTSGAKTITACPTGCTSTTNSEQFGINLKDNTSPNIGAEVSGSAPIGVAAAGYSTADTFQFATGETIASSASGINSSVFTISYLANISASTESGSYATTLTYVATANF